PYKTPLLPYSTLFRSCLCRFSRRVVSRLSLSLPCVSLCDISLLGVSHVSVSYGSLNLLVLSFRSLYCFSGLFLYGFDNSVANIVSGSFYPIRVRGGVLVIFGHNVLHIQ